MSFTARNIDKAIGRLQTLSFNNSKEFVSHVRAKAPFTIEHAHKQLRPNTYIMTEHANGIYHLSFDKNKTLQVPVNVLHEAWCKSVIDLLCEEDFVSSVDKDTVDRTSIVKSMESNGITVTELAKQCGVQPPAISRLLRLPDDDFEGSGRNPSIELAGKVCAVLNLNIETAFPDLFKTSVNEELNTGMLAAGLEDRLGDEANLSIAANQLLATLKRRKELRKNEDELEKTVSAAIDELGGQNVA